MINKQKRNDDCVITCLEFLLDFNYNYLLENLGYEADVNNINNFLKYHNYNSELLLTELGSKEFNTDYIDVYNIKEFLNNNNNNKCLITTKNNYTYHCLAYYNNNLYDPLIGNIVEIDKIDIYCIIIII